MTEKVLRADTLQKLIKKYERKLNSYQLDLKEYPNNRTVAVLADYTTDIIEDFKKLQGLVIISPQEHKEQICNANNGWISVKDKLPEIGWDEDYEYASEMILVSDGEFVYSGQYEDSPEFGAAFIDENGDSFEDDGIKITHWMNKPAPPKLDVTEH